MGTEKQVLYLLGEVHGKLEAQGQQLDRVERSMDMQRKDVRNLHVRMSALPCDHHAQQLGELYAKNDEVRETTAKFRIAEVERTAVRRWWARVGRVLWETKVYWLPPLLVAAACAVGLAAVR